MSTFKKTLMRVPEVTFLFWIAKTLSTTVGETGADFLAVDLGFGMPLVTVLMTALLTTLLVLQFTRFKRYVPENYWAMVVLMSVIGTLITDMFVDIMGVSLVTLTVVFTLMMLAGFYLWYRSEKTLSIHSIDTSKREAYYWIVILIAFALGTGAGDLISEHFSMGYGTALLLFIGMIITVTGAYFVFKMNGVLAFWLAYILTRPLGASLGDFLIQPVDAGGLGINMVFINLAFLTAIITSVAYLSVQNKKLQKIQATNS
jgi:uncharacterized membrane-anchored protein